MFKPRRRCICKLLLVGLVFFAVFISLQTYLFVVLERICLSITDDVKENIVVWWTPFTLESGNPRQCGDVSCFFSNNRKYRNHQNFKALLFYGSKFNVSDLPLPRGNVLWGLLHEESPRNTPILAHNPLLNLFNYSSTFSRSSDLPLTLQYLTSIEDLTSTKYYRTFEEKEELLTTLAPVVYIQSDCITPTNRDSYVAELMDHIKVDSYGLCLNNKELPNNLKNSMRTMMSPEMFKFISQYKFAIAFENGICDDYITEKLWRPLIAGVVPIYVGSPSVRDVLPNNKSAIFVKDFDSPKELARFLSKLNRNKAEYESYQDHKLKKRVENDYLVREMKNRVWSADDDYNVVSFIDLFECYVCRMTHEPRPAIVTEKHYQCSDPVSIINWNYNASNWWHRDWAINRCAASLLRQRIDANSPITERELFEMSFGDLENKRCK